MIKATLLGEDPEVRMPPDYAPPEPREPYQRRGLIVAAIVVGAWAIVFLAALIWFILR